MQSSDERSEFEYFDNYTLSSGVNLLSPEQSKYKVKKYKVKKYKVKKYKVKKFKVKKYKVKKYKVKKYKVKECTL